MRNILFILILLPLMVHADAVEIDGIYYNLIAKAKCAEVTCGPFTYNTDDRGNKIPSKGFYEGNIVIPEYVAYEGVTYDVVAINGGKEFYYFSPGGEYSNHGGAFYLCTELTSITIPNSVTLIGDDTFSDCTGLSSITIPESVTSIGNNAFENCTGLSSITIPESVTKLGKNVFYNCTGLTGVTLPLSLPHIESGMFFGCTQLSSITIPNSVTSIGSDAFSPFLTV